MNYSEFKLELDKLITANYDMFLSVAHINLLDQYRSKYYKYDVVSEVIMQLYKTFDNNPEKYIKIMESGKMKFYIKGVIYINCRLTTAPYIRNLKKTDTLPTLKRKDSSSDFNPVIEIDNADYKWEENYTVLNLEDNGNDYFKECLYDGVYWLNSELRPDSITQVMVNVFNTVSSSDIRIGDIAKMFKIRRFDAVVYNEKCVNAIKEYLKQ